MDDSTFDWMARALGSGVSRRSVVKTMLGIGGAVAGFASAGETDAARRGFPGPNLPLALPTPTCTPKTCADYPGQCATLLDNGCGGPLDCSNSCQPPSVCNGTTCIEPGTCTAADNFCVSREFACGYGNCACFQSLTGASVCSVGVSALGCGSCDADSDCPEQTGNPNSVCVTTDDTCTTCADGGVCAVLCILD